MESNNKKRQDKKRPAIFRQSSSGSTSSEIQILLEDSAQSQSLFLQKIHEGSEAVNKGDFHLAIQAYTEAISLDPTNHILYTNRSTAYAKIQQYKKSLLDAKKSQELNPKWAKVSLWSLSAHNTQFTDVPSLECKFFVAYIREGTALQQLGQHADALAAFASGLAQDTNSASLLSGLKEAALKCPLKEKLEPCFQKMQQLDLDKSPFVIISVIGQELLQAGHYHASTQMLEAALKIGTCSQKLRSSVVSALSSAYWGLGNMDQAITYMQKDLQVAKNLGDVEGQCRAYGNLGSAYFSKGHYKEALSHDRFQLVLAMRLKDRHTANVALSRLGHVYTAIGDYPNALQSHKQCVLLLKQINDKLAEAREIGNVGAVYLAMGNFDTAVECHLEHLKIAKGLKNSVEEARAFSNLGSAYHYKRNYEKAILYHKQVLKIAEQKCDKSLEARAYAGLGHAARCMQDYGMSKTYHEKQLDNALQTRDKVAEGRACANLGIIFHQLGEYEAALKLHKVHLSIAKDLGDRASQGRALGNIGNAFCALNKYDQAIKYHKQELAISTEVNDRHSEGSTHGNLAVAYQTLKMYDSAHQHYVAHLNISRELKDSQSEARAVCNLGNFHSSRGEYTNSIPYYEQYLMLSQELHDSEGEAKGCFCLGYAHFALGNFQESVRYYEQDLSIAQELKNQLGIARAYCNLGLAHKALNNFTEALDCQKKCLNLMTTLKNVKGKFRSLGNIGDVLLKTGDTSEAIKFYNQQLQLAKQSNNQDMLASANGALGAAHRTIAQYDKALGFHTQELSLRQDMSDLKGECRAHGNLGSVHMCLGKYMNAYKCYEEQLEKSRELKDSTMEANACGNLAITKMNMGNFEEAIGLFEQQLAILEQVHGNNATFDKGRAFGNLGDCYEALGDFEESIKCHEQYLAIAQSSGHLSDQDRAYRGLGNAHRSVGNLQQALVCFEKRLVVAHELNSSMARASAYGELGCLHSLLGNFEQAILCLQHQLAIAREMNDSLCEGDAACGLGGVYQQMGEYEKALEYHEMDLKIAEKTKNTACQCRAYGNLGLSHESLGEYTMAIRYQEQHLSIAAQMNDRVAKTLAYSSLGRVHHALNNRQKAVEYLRQGLQIAEQLGRMEDEAKIRHRLGLALWGNGDYNECQLQLYKASELFESIRRNTQFNREYKLSLFDLQTACYQALQRVLVSLNRHQEALVVAERACTRAFIDLLMERQAGSDGFYGNHVTDPPPITSDQITSIVQKQKSMVLYFSVAAGFLYGWLLTPRDGIVKYHVTSMMDVENEVDSSGDNTSMKSSVSYSACSLLDNMVGQIHEFMGVDTPSNVYRGTSRSMSLDNDGVSDVEDHWERNMEELGDKLNAENDRTGFLRIVNRNHIFNSSNYSLGSLLSLNPSLNASLPDTVSYRKNSARNKLGQKSAISALYQLLIEPFEEAMKEKTEEAGSNPSDLILVLQGDLYLIPFSVLRKDQTKEYLFERFNLIVVPSLTSLQSSNKHQKHGRPVIDSSGAVVVGNPKLTSAICQHWHLHDIPASEYEARIVGEILTVRPLIGHEATKVAVLNQIEQVEVIHFATHISWKLSSVILSPGEVPSHPTRFPTIDSDDSASDISSFDGPSLAEYLLTAADILNLKLHAKLVVLSAGYTDDQAGRINTDGVVGLTRSLLSAGAQCVLYCLWPIPDQASKLLMRTLYLGLQEGKRVSQALTFAVKTVQSSKQYSHPSNWGGWVLIGQDVQLSSKVAQMGHAICELLQNPSQCREAMRVLLHLIEKSLQRIHQGAKNSMYTTAQSIENKVGGLSGWKDLLQAVGFRFEPSLNGLPPAVFFPQSDPGDRLTQASASLQSLLGLPQGCLQALPKFFHNYEAGEAIIRVMRDILSKLVAKDTNMDVKVNVKLWRVSGCHEFVASLCMDLVEVGDNEITLRLGKQASKRHLQFALQSLVTIFDTLETPRSLHLDSSSSLESLSSSHSGSTSTSNFSKGSTPPLSPRSKRKSLFNPAEMEKMRIRNNRMSQGGLAGRKIMSDKSLKQSVTDPATCLQYQNQIKFMYRDGGSMSPQDGNEVSVMAFSDSDTTTSPILGDSANSDKMREIQTAESYSLSFDARNDKSGKGDKSDSNENELSDSDDRKSCVLPEVLSARTNVTEHESVKNHQKTEDGFVYVEDQSFQRNVENWTSDISNSSISQGIQADKDCRKRNSDLSDMSANSNGYLTPKNKTELDKFIPLTDESGIVSEIASSNQSESSQLSNMKNFKFDPAEIAKKIMNDVSEHKIALDSFQKLSILQSQTESNFLRSEYKKKSYAPSAVKYSVSKSESILPNGSDPTIATISGNTHSAFISPSHTSLPLSLTAVKSALPPNTSNFQSVYANMANLASIPNKKPSFTDSTIKQLEVMLDNGEHVVTQKSVNNVFPKTAIVVNKTNSISFSTSNSVPLSFSTFRPNKRPIQADGRPIQADGRPIQADGKPTQVDGRPTQADGRPIQADGRPIQADGRPIQADGRPVQADDRTIQADGRPIQADGRPIQAGGRPIQADSRPIQADGRPIQADGRPIQADDRLIQAENISNIVQYRPESTTSTSSYCSTLSSLQSIIYRPLTENHVQDSQCADPHDSHSAQVIDRESPATATSNAIGSGYKMDNMSTIPNQKRDSSPALSSSSSASVHNGKQKKKVSFSDSEPSDTPSPLDSSANSNTLSYFEMKRYNLGSVASKSPSACSSSDGNGIIKTAPQILRPPPPSYLYAVRNSQYIVNKSEKEEKSTRLPSQSQSSSSSLNNSLDEIDHAMPQETSLRRYAAGTLFQDSCTIKNKTNVPQQQQTKYNGTVTQNTLNINTNPNYQFQNTSTSSVNLHILQGQLSQGQQLQGHMLQGQHLRDHPFSALHSPAADKQPALFAPEIPPRGIALIQKRPNNVTFTAPVEPPHQPALRMQKSPEYHGSVSCISPKREKLPFQTQTTSHSGSLTTTIMSSEQKAPNFAPFSSTQFTVLRHPLTSMKSRVPQMECFSPPTQFHTLSESHRENIPQPDYGRSQSIEVFDQYNHHEPFKQLQNYELKTYSGTQVLNHYSPHLKEMAESATNQKHVQQTNHYATTNLLPTISDFSNEQSARRNYPVPPTSMDSFENMDQCINGHLSEQRMPDNALNGQSIEGYGEHGQNNYSTSFVPKEQNVCQTSFVPNSKYYSNNEMPTQNGFFKNVSQQMYDSCLTQPIGNQHVQPIRSTVQQLPINVNTSNGNVSNLRNNLNSYSQSMPVGTGSDKRCFARTNVIQPSKC